MLLKQLNRRESMSFFSGHRSARTMSPPSQHLHHSELDPVILNIGLTTDLVIRKMLTDCRQSWERTRRWVAERQAADEAWRAMEARRLEQQHPGYREELNRQRAALGLPPV